MGMTDYVYLYVYAQSVKSVEFYVSWPVHLTEKLRFARPRQNMWVRSSLAQRFECDLSRRSLSRCLHSSAVRTAAVLLHAFSASFDCFQPVWVRICHWYGPLPPVWILLSCTRSRVFALACWLGVGLTGRQAWHANLV